MGFPRQHPAGLLFLALLLGPGCVPELRPATTAGGEDTDQPTCMDDPSVCDTARCDPLFQDCGPAAGCYPVGSGFDCAERTSDGRVGDPCTAGPQCLPGTMCAHGASVPDCNAVGCCAEFCDLSDGASSCKLASQGATCVAFYQAQDAPPGLEAVGVCSLASSSL